MVGHLIHADLTEPDRPASLSSRAVQGLLRTTLGYEGVVVSDDMQMGAVTQIFQPDDRIVFGIEAGVDLFRSIRQSRASGLADARTFPPRCENSCRK